MFEAYLGTLPGALSLGLIWGIAAIGVFITFKVLDLPDLTVDGSFATGGIVCALVISNGGHFMLGLLMGFIAGMIAGLITGILHTSLGIPAILAGILTQLSLYSINLALTQGRTIVSISPIKYDLLLFSGDTWGALWKMAIIIAIVAGILYLFFGTELGASIRATGNNPDMARAQGINVKLRIVIGLAISNALVGLAGALFAQYNGSGNITAGTGAIVFGLCAIVIGGAIFSKISPNFLVRLIGVAVGSIIYQIVFQSIVFFTDQTDLLKLFAAIVVTLFLGVPYLRRVYSDKINRSIANRKIRSGGNTHD